MVNAEALIMDLANVLAGAGCETADDVRALPRTAWCLAFQLARPNSRRPADAAPSARTREAVSRFVERRGDVADADPFRGFPA